MSNPKVRNASRRLLQLVTMGTVYEHFLEQQQRALNQEKITKPIPKSKLQAYAREYYSTIRQELRNCESTVDVRLVTDLVIRDIGPTRMGFLQADWKGSRKATLEALN